MAKNKSQYDSTLNLPKTLFEMRAGLPKKEPVMLKDWDDNDLYNQLMKHNEGKPQFILHDGPPYANGNIHMGTALNKIIKDIIIREKNMEGFQAPYVPGFDTHGLPIELKALSSVGEKKKDISKLELRQICEKFATEHIDIMSDQFKRLGVIGDFEHPYLTLKPEFEARQIEIFGEMAKKGYIYKGLKPVYWCPDCRTALAEAEIEYGEDECDSIFVRFHVSQDPNGVLAKHGIPMEKTYFVICLALIMGGPALGVPTMLATRLSFIITGAWWLIFTLPLIRTYKQKYGRERGPEDTIGHIVGGVFSEVGHTMREIAHNKTVLVYMIAFFFYIDGVHTVISMATSYGSALGIDSTQLVLALLVTQFVAFPSAIIYGKLAGRVGTLNMILVAVAAYMGIVLFAAFFLKTAFEFWVLAIMVGLFQGGVQALSRSYFGRIIPKEKSNEYYGFFDIFGRYASVMGTFLVSVVTSLTGNPSLGVLSIGVLLIVGFMLLVRLSRMTRAAEHAA